MSKFKAGDKVEPDYKGFYEAIMNWDYKIGRCKSV